MTFKQLGISPGYIKGLKELGIINPTEIQEKAIPILLEEETDFIGLAQTGTGKTAAYGLPILNTIDVEIPLVQALILSPTRELVQQIQKQLFRFTKYVDDRIFSEAIFGGEKIDKQIARLTRPTHIIVATPGRLIDLIERKSVDLRNIKTLVLDEADEMLSMGFKKELDRILQFTQGNRKTWLFSATFPEDIKQIVKNYMSEYQQIEIDKDSLVNANISHKYIFTSVKNKLDTLINLLESKGEERGIIFCRTKLGTQKLAKELQEEGFSVGALEGDMQQKERDKVMRAFKKENLQYLVSTDVSARGIDVRGLGFIVHHQLPEKLEYYTHRSGRTARAGEKGNSIALIIPTEMQQIYDLQNRLGILFEEV
ncbi:MAG: DEAD/DEAH box helicase [Flavobacteriaceae bacterium]|nr:DEAD/DEAH box helicase [Flavobacteriaceae bacterium]